MAIGLKIPYDNSEFSSSSEVFHTGLRDFSILFGPLSLLAIYLN